MTYVLDRAEEIAERVVGTCESLTEVEDADLMTVPDLAAEFDDLAWECETCGWWVSTHETDDDGNCSDCQEDEDESDT